MPQTDSIPKTQWAVQLIGPGQLRLNRSKPVDLPGPRQILARVEAVGLCFSDLKLLKAFAEHPRKGEIKAGLAPAVLSTIPSYVPGDAPTVPGHEAVCRIVAVGGGVGHHRVGERVLVQSDYRALSTGKSNAAFGYNFEGALQEYVIFDERVVLDPATGERFLIPVDEDLSASAVCLVEPWACVEDAYVSEERRAPKSGGRMLVVADEGREMVGLTEAVKAARPGTITALCTGDAQRKAISAVGSPRTVTDISSLPDDSFDDIIYFGSRAEKIAVLGDKLAARGIINIVTGGNRIGAPVSVGVGRVHYGPTRWIGTTGRSAAESYATIPATGEIRANDRIHIIGAAGPMGQMHVLRCLASGVPGIEVAGTDFDDARLASLRAKAEGLARAGGVRLELVNPKTAPLKGAPTYVALMAPVGALVAEAVASAARNCIINIFAGIPAGVKQEIDLDRYIEKRCYLLGTSGSVIHDMKIVLAKVEAGRLDTNASVDAVSGMEGAIDGLAAVEKRTLAGKIIVYPSLHNMPLMPLDSLSSRLAGVGAKLASGGWTKAAEDELLRSGA